MQPLPGLELRTHFPAYLALQFGASSQCERAILVFLAQFLAKPFAELSTTGRRILLSSYETPQLRMLVVASPPATNFP